MVFSRQAERGAAHAAKMTVEAPKGPLGLTFSTSAGGPTVDIVNPDSPLHLEVGVGWKLIGLDDVNVRKFNCGAAAKWLKENENRERTLIFEDPVRFASLILGKDLIANKPAFCKPVTVDAPAGRLGLTLRTRDGSATVHSVKAASPLVHRVGVGWRLLAVDGVDCSSMDHDAAVKLLHDSAGRSRTLTFDDPTITHSPGVEYALQFVYPAVLVLLIALCVGIYENVVPGGIRALGKDIERSLEEFQSNVKDRVENARDSLQRPHPLRYPLAPEPR